VFSSRDWPTGVGPTTVARPVTPAEIVGYVVAAGFDAGIRLHETMERDMTAVRLTGRFRFIVVGSPAYLRRHGRPTYRWELEKGGRTIELAVQGQLTTNNDEVLLQAALDGVGLSYVREPAALHLLRARKLEVVLPDWACSVPGLFLYFPRGAQHTPALRAFLDTARDLLPR
jgi:DNA-binding transcriptional LysR family regulator